MGALERWRESARGLKRETYAIYLAARHERTPWYAKVFVLAVAGYAFSPIDLIPDFIPVLGYLDDLLIVPLGISLAIRMIPPDVLDECRREAHARLSGERPTNWAAAAVIVAIWIVSIVVVGYLAYRSFWRG